MAIACRVLLLYAIDQNIVSAAEEADDAVPPEMPPNSGEKHQQIRKMMALKTYKCSIQISQAI